ncbi:hypothetical protein TRIP_B330274 [uncultured Desulfatiglans sp.]|uniref:Uncharacterized protein n=1 Tax=Uncultured Desulfatiglans sp. TaxID=1748965 RepID=A0A653A7W9_UNCDX|nr:hypothetical protein TRIP_B330274 [uncultured Desulfatiglans sp.]
MRGRNLQVTTQANAQITAQVPKKDDFRMETNAYGSKAIAVPKDGKMLRKTAY